MKALPSDFINRISKVYGDAGESWLNQLPELRKSVLDRWSLTGGDPLYPLTYNYLENAEDRNGTAVILKLGVPSPELTTEILALQQYSGKGAVRIIQGDPEQGALLLERVYPGTNLLGIENDEIATRTACQVMQRIWIEAPDGGFFPNMADWCRGFNRYGKQYPGDSGPLPKNLIHRGEALAQELLQNQNTSLLLHGDLHHMNILLGEGGSWIAIDPKGVIGEPSFEVGPLLTNPTSDLITYPNLEQVLSRRLDILTETLALDRFRMAAWSFTRAVLSAVWVVEDQGDNWVYWTTIAECMRVLIPK